MLLIKEFASWLVILIIITANISIDNIKTSSVLFTLFYTITYILGTNRFLSILGITILGIIFDSVNNIIIGFSSTILIFTNILYFFFNKENNSLTIIIYYVVAILNILIIAVYSKLLLIYFDFHFINLLMFITLGIISLFVFYPITLITKRIIYNAK